SGSKANNACSVRHRDRDFWTGIGFEHQVFSADRLDRANILDSSACSGLRVCTGWTVLRLQRRAEEQTHTRSEHGQRVSPVRRKLAFICNQSELSPALGISQDFFRTSDQDRGQQAPALLFVSGVSRYLL